MIALRVALWAVLIFVMHFIWEMCQMPWFAGTENMPMPFQAWLCFRATFGDLAITAIAFAGGAAAARSFLWPLRRLTIGAAVYMTIGLAITAVYEVVALQTGRWAYGANMWTIYGVGFAPLLQWTVIPPLTLLAFRRIFR